MPCYRLHGQELLRSVTTEYRVPAHRCLASTMLPSNRLLLYLAPPSLARGHDAWGLDWVAVSLHSQRSSEWARSWSGLDLLLCYIVSSEWARATEYPGPLPCPRRTRLPHRPGSSTSALALHHNAGCRIASYCILHHQLGLGLICCRATVYMGKSCYVASLSTAFLHIALSVHNAAVESPPVFRTTQLGSGS